MRINFSTSTILTPFYWVGAQVAGGVENIKKIDFSRLTSSISLSSATSRNVGYLGIGVVLTGIMYVAARRFGSPKVKEVKPEETKELSQELKKAKTVIEACIERLNEAIKVKAENELKGIFRVPGTESLMLKLMEAINAEQDIKKETLKALLSRDGVTHNDVAKLMSRVIKSLKSPLLTEEEGDLIVDYYAIKTTEDEKLDLLKKSFSFGAIGEIYRPLFTFLNQLLASKNKTSMDAANLAMCWAPVLLPVPATLEKTKEKTKNSIVVVQYIIEHAPQIFSAEK